MKGIRPLNQLSVSFINDLLIQLVRGLVYGSDNNTIVKEWCS